ncbi:MAG: hypothetical protein AUK47_05140 [Deltaproteobacteria bacterium CG2_30_63_29]|nr:MAG: hypothetical protein AUK47_05140 [Deltaproteobacteria bacterium CG2_30_63_29]
MSRIAARNLLMSLAAVALVLAAVESTALADKVHAKFKGKIVLSDAPFPTSFDSDAQAIKVIKNASKKEFVQNKKGTWSIEYMAFLKEKLDAKEAIIVFYDITYRGDHEEVYSEGMRPDDPYSNVVINFIALPAEFFQAGHEYEMQLLRGRNTKALAVATFKLKE